MKDADLVIRGGTIIDGTGSPGYVGDVAIKDDRIIAVGHVPFSGREEIAAQGKIVTPGFVDIHTHYDGQATWSDRLAPSSRYGVTTVLIGNCGVGFAPCRPDDRQRLIKVMEGVEDIPGVVMAEGIPWEWETFPEFLDFLDNRPHDIDVAAQFPHSALRVYVMGSRGANREVATPEDLEKMASLTREAMRAGALGFGTSRTFFHRTLAGEFIPTFESGEAELQTIAGAMKDEGRGVFQLVYDIDLHEDVEGEFNLMRRLVAESGRPLSFSLTQHNTAPDRWRQMLDLVSKANEDGLPIRAQVYPRPIGMIIGFSLSANPFSLCPSFEPLANLPHAELIAELRKPEVKERLLQDTPDPSRLPLLMVARNFERMFVVTDPMDYEQPFDKSVQAQADRMGIRPEELAYDLLLENDGKAMLYIALGNYADGNLDPVYDMLRHENSVVGIGDGGAHYSLICDSSYPIYMLTYWARDRAGGKLSLEAAVKSMTSSTAQAIGLNDRGILAEGFKADINVIDYDELVLDAPHVQYDLPAGGRRLIQDAKGFVATIVNGKVILRDDVYTDALPGRLVRGPQAAPVASAAVN